jgi:hypothetical protein
VIKKKAFFFFFTMVNAVPKTKRHCASSDLKRAGLPVAFPGIRNGNATSILHPSISTEFDARFAAAILQCLQRCRSLPHRH